MNLPNEHIYLLANKYILIPGLKMHSDWNLFKIRSVWFRYIYSMINHSHSFTYKRNIFLTKILANAPIIVFYVHLHAVCLSDILKVMVQFLNHSNTCILKTCSIYVQLHLPMGDTCSVSMVILFSFLAYGSLFTTHWLSYVLYARCAWYMYMLLIREEYF